MSNPLLGRNGVCFLTGLLMFTGYKCVTIYEAIVAINLFYKLWRPMNALGIPKKYIHFTAITTIIVWDIIVVACV